MPSRLLGGDTVATTDRLGSAEQAFFVGGRERGYSIHWLHNISACRKLFKLIREILTVPINQQRHDQSIADEEAGVDQGSDRSEELCDGAEGPMSPNTPVTEPPLIRR